MGKKLIYKYPLILIISYAIFAFFFGYISIYGMKMFFELKTGMIYEFDYVLSSLYDIGIMDIQFELCLIIVIYIFAIYLDRFTIDELGLKMSITSLKRFIYGGAFAAFFIILPYILCVFTKSIDFKGLYFQYNTDIDKLYISMIYDFILLFLVAIQEELLNRAYLITNMKKQKPLFAIIISSILFALLHLQNPSIDFINNTITSTIGIFNIFLIGIIFGTYYIHTNDLYFVIGAHLFWNFMQGSVFGLPISGDPSVGLFISQNIGNTLFAGGDFGLEGGLLVTFSLIFMYVVLKKRVLADI